LTPRAWMADGRWDEITRLAKRFAAAAVAARDVEARVKEGRAS